MMTEENISPLPVEAETVPPVQPEAVTPPPPPAPPAEPIAPTPSPHEQAKSLLAKALEKIQFRKKAKLEKIVKLASQKGVVTNDDIEKLLHVSDATATRYLSELVKQNKLRRTGATTNTRYEPTLGSNGGN